MPEESSPQRLSVPIETLLPRARRSDESCHDQPDHCWRLLEIETLIVGSGYGAAMAAVQLAGKREPAGIWVFERGREVVPGEFPKTIASLPKEVSITTHRRFFGEKDALWDIRHGTGITAVLARGVGGGSLTNANVAYPPPEDVLKRWPREPGQPEGYWSTRLQPSVHSVEQLLSATPATDLQDLSKFVALNTIAGNLGADARKTVKLTVRLEQEAGPNRVGVEQRACTRCGNCITGCNVGAKGSLDMNVWPLARTLGVKIYSGATVHSIAPVRLPRGRGWRVFASSTYDDQVHFEVQAYQVILAAGTFGSTEILQRSADAHQLPLSTAQLGRRFSGNGDVLAYAEGQAEPVNATSSSPSVESDERQHEVGPTVIGAAEVAAVEGERPGFLLEDGAAPYPTRRVLEEVLVTRNLIRRFKDGRSPAWLRPDDRTDAVAATLEAGRHHQLLLAMSDDGARGTLERSEQGGLVGSWPEGAPAREFQSGIRNALGAADPARRGRTPRDTSSPIRELDKLDDLIVTVHPLGGCCLARTAEEGVVNLEGKVFSGQRGTETHEGLYVLDGSIIPGALGVNPFLTISALAHRLAADIPSTLPATGARPASVAPEWQKRPEPQSADPIANPGDEALRAKITERFYLRLSPAQQRLAEQVLGQQLRNTSALVMEMSARVQDAFAWLAEPAQPLPAVYQLFTSTVDFGDTVPTTALEPVGSPIAGHVIFGDLDACGGRPWLRLWRTATVVGSFLYNRGDELRPRLPKSVPSLKQLRDLLSGVRGFFRVACAQTDYRYMRYTFAGEGLAFEGVKSLKYFGRDPDPLQTLRALPFTLKSALSRQVLEGTLRVDVIRFTGEPAALQVERTPDTLTTVVALGAALLFFGRGVLQSMFWSFRRPKYDTYPDPAKSSEPRLGRSPSEAGSGSGWLTTPGNSASGLGFVPERLRYRAADGRGRWQTATAKLIEHSVGQGTQARTIRLTRYSPDESASRPRALLIHGLACGSRAFWTDTVDTPMAQYLLGQGYDVWLLDYSSSVNLHEKPNRTLTLDDVAKEDIPWAVQTASADGEQPVHVFAHCVGAGAFAMAVLSGQLSKGGKKLVASAALHAVSPWLVGSEDNRLRANVLALVKDWVNDDFDPIPHRDPDRLDTFYDALASSFSWGKDRARHCKDDVGQLFSRTICNRMTLFYGQEWGHDNLDPRTHRRLDSIVGPGSVQIMLQAFFCVERGRLTDREGKNVYVQAQNFDAYWNFRTLFLHGDNNKVFSVESARRSAVELSALHASAQDRGVAAALKDADAYLRERAVSVVVCPDYGHMDMVFGKNAAVQVFQHLSRFFGGEQLRQGSVQPLSVTQPAAETYPVVGPIISRPDGKKKQLRVWMATSDLAASRPEAVSFDQQSLPLKRARAPRLPGSASAEFWMGDLRVDPALLDGVPRVTYPSLRRATPEGFVAMPGAPLAEREPEALRWNELPWFQRAFCPGKSDGRIAFALGSCLYPGFSTEQGLSDSVFERIKGFVVGKNGRGIDHVLLLGDQIYADALGEAFPARSPLEHFRNRYRRAFGGPTAEMGKWANWVFSHVPTYFAIDDHEIANDWARKGNGLSEDETTALDEAYNFQMHHDLCGGSANAGRFWYTFESAGFPFFVFDTRSERQANVSREDANALLSEQQRQAFAGWLREHDGPSCKPLFVASGSALAPLPKDIVAHPELALRSDGLIGFPGFLRWLHGVLKGVQRPIVWLAGDLHCSTISELEFAIGGETARWVQVCASGLFAPLPFANTSLQSFAMNGPVQFVRDDLRITASHRLLIEGAQGCFVQVVFSACNLAVRAVPADRNDPKGKGPWWRKKFPPPARPALPPEDRLPRDPRLPLDEEKGPTDEPSE